MKAALKFVMTSVGLLLIGLCFATILLLTRFEGILRDGLTHQAGRILQGEVHLEAVRFDWADQAIVFKGVSLLNPEGFTDREALRIGTMRVKPEPLTLFSRTPGVATISLEDLQLHLQYRSDGGTNLGALMTHADTWADKQDAEEVTVWGRPIRLDSVNTEGTDVAVEALAPASPSYIQAVPAYTMEFPPEDEAITGARTIQRLLQGFLDSLRKVDGLAPELKSVLDREQAQPV